MARNSSRGLLFIILGIILFFLGAGQFLVQLLLALVGLYLINYGLTVQGQPPLLYIVQSWLDRIKF